MGGSVEHWLHVVAQAVKNPLASLLVVGPLSHGDFPLWLDDLLVLVFHVHDDVIKWKHFPRYWPFVRGIHRSPVNSPHKGQWRGALMFSLICVWINGWVNNGQAGYLRRFCAHYDVTVMFVAAVFSSCVVHLSTYISMSPLYHPEFIIWKTVWMLKESKESMQENRSWYRQCI